GGTHCERSSDVALFLITSEGRTAAGIRRIEAVTGRAAYQLVRSRFQEMKEAAAALSSGPDQLASQVNALVDQYKTAEKTRDKLLRKLAVIELDAALQDLDQVGDVKLLTRIVEEADLDTLRLVADRFRQLVPERGIIVLGTVIADSPRLVAAVTEDLIQEGYKAGELVQYAARPIGGGGGGRPAMAEAGGKHPEKLQEALASVPAWIKDKTKS
ncbi:MAG: DHHA1 domain-containing protein, partial [Anaerolineales bacterium]